MFAVMAFAIQLGGEFIWDDTTLVVLNELTGDWRNIPRFFTVSLWETTPMPDPNRNFYRPLMLLELWLDRSLVDPPVAWLHRLHNLLWHLGGGLLLFVFLQRLRPGGWLAFPAAALYTLHPLQNEVVAFTAARNDAMASFGMLAVLIVLLPRQVSGRRLAVAGALLAGALLSKEVAVATPLILIGLDWMRHGRPTGLSRHAVLWSVVIAWTALRLILNLESDLALPPDLVGWAGHSAQILVAPWTTSPTAYLDAAIPIGWALPLLGGILIALLVKGGPQARLGLVWAVMTLLPCIPVVAATGQMPYRYLTLPLAGLAVALHAAWQKHWSPWAGVVLASGLAAVTLTQAPQWQDSVALWQRGWQTGPSSRSACGVFKALENDALALVWLKRALEAPPAQYCCLSATTFALDRGNPLAAVALGTLALDQGCDATPELLAPLAIAEAATGQWDAAEAHALDALPDPTGLAPVVLSAAALRRGDASVLQAWSERDSQGSASSLEDQVQWLLDFDER
jgi:hypothetical protein